MDEHGRTSDVHGGMQLDFYHGNNKKNDLRSYSVNSSYTQSQLPYEFDYKLAKSKTTSGSSSKVWCFSDPEFKRKKRVASYRAYSVEGKVKGSLRKTFKWLKERFLFGW